MTRKGYHFSHTHTHPCQKNPVLIEEKSRMGKKICYKKTTIINKPLGKSKQFLGV